MESTVVAPQAGVVEDILLKEGVLIEQDDVIITIKFE
jgi:biotin carboxyl carrier protein